MIVIAGLFLFRAPVYAPDTEFIVGGFSSDTAIPILMANSDYFSPFSLYYWGQDRFGAWPFLVLRLLPDVSDFQVFLAMFVYLHAGLLVFFWNRDPFAFLSVLSLLHIWQGTSGFLFDIAQPYGWQLGSILIALTCLESTNRTARAAGGFLSGPALCTGLFSFLAIWLSPSSILYSLAYPILRLAPTDGLRSLLSSAQISRLFRLWIPAIAAYVAHSLLRRSVVAYNKEAFYNKFETPLRWQLDLVTPAWKAVLQSLQTPEIILWALTLIMLTFLAMALFLGLGKWARFARRYPMEVNLLAASLLFLLALLPLNWFYLNQFGIRYIALPRFLMVTGVLLLILRMASRLKPPFQLSIRYAGLALLAVTLLWTPGVLPTRKESAGYQERKRVAEFLEREYPGIPILGNYWETYVYAALQNRRNIPQPGTGQYQRTPFLVPEFLEASTIIVNHRGYDRTVESDGNPLTYFRFRSQQYKLEEHFQSQGVPFSAYSLVR